MEVAVSRWPQRPAGFAYGGDYNPEQWPQSVWADDIALMREAGVNLVNLGIFSWVLMEPAPGEFDFGWLDRVLDLLHEGGIAVDLATPTAAPPAWLSHREPTIRPVTRDGVRLGGGARASFCPSSPAYRAAAARITEELGARYGNHPAVVLWHVHNEYGGHVPACYCDNSAKAFRDWLRARYDGLAALNDAWGTTFWGQRYGDWAEIDVPRRSSTAVNPTQQLDFLRFCSDELLACFRAERDILHRLSPGVPVTTNFMASTCKYVDYWAWAREVDVVSNDHYLRSAEPENYIDLALAADLTRSLAGGAAWLLMEHSTSAVNWQPRNIAKRPGELRRNSLAHVARGSDSVLFFQWRASRQGAEKFHSAMLPHGGTATRIWHEVVDLGADLQRLAELRGSTVLAPVALMWDWQSWWALELEWRPSVELDFRSALDTWYGSLWRDHVTVDFVHPEADLSRYRVVLAPSLYLLTDAAARNVAQHTREGGTVLVGPFSGVVDATDAVHRGGPPGPLRDVLGISVEEALPLRAGEQVHLSDSTTANCWAEVVTNLTAEVVLSYLDGPAAGCPALTRHRYGAGSAWYLSTRPDPVSAVLRLVYGEAGLVPADLPDGVEVIHRTGGGHEYLVAINHTDKPVEIAANGEELLTGVACHGLFSIPAGEVRVVRS
ncbi:MAG TPA: beta-galactosidase [Micromonosporaceae bacterium]|jgi:beta-galactosidase